VAGMGVAALTTAKLLPESGDSPDSLPGRMSR
jgi:hypothetical protein